MSEGGLPRDRLAAAPAILRILVYAYALFAFLSIFGVIASASGHLSHSPFDGLGSVGKPIVFAALGLAYLVIATGLSRGRRTARLLAVALALVGLAVAASLREWSALAYNLALLAGLSTPQTRQYVSDARREA